jgi:GH15 family glucan-1,4-alpha-glucosidase
VQGGHAQTWAEALQSAARLEIPDDRMQFLYDAAIRTVTVLSPDLTYPGPYTYKRFWYRDAAFLIHALLNANLCDRAERVLTHFPEKQNPLTGYFHSQEGEWDSNGQAIWAFFRFCQSTGKPLPQDWRDSVKKGVKWIIRKRLSDALPELHAGLFPPGFSAEHLGNIDYYYWDAFWNVAGLHTAAQLFDQREEAELISECRREEDRLLEAVERSLRQSRQHRDFTGIPASPYRRMDSGAIGSIVAGYPLRLLPPQEARLLSTIEFLRDRCFVRGAFFQDMIHSGINAYLSLHIAEVLLRAGDMRFFEIVRVVAELASPTGQWPEAIHPRTSGGCMGDGQHSWAAAEWIVMMRNMFVREESDRLVLGSGIPEAWLAAGQRLAFGPTPTPFGTVSVSIEPCPDALNVVWQADWRNQPPAIDVAVPGYEPQTLDDPAPNHSVGIRKA